MADTAQGYAMHPAVMDAAFQATGALALDGPTEDADGAGKRRPVLLPFAIDSLDVVGPCETTMWAWIRASATPAAGDGLRKLDIDLRSEERRVGKEWFSTCSSRWSP